MLWFGRIRPRSGKPAATTAVSLRTANRLAAIAALAQERGPLPIPSLLESLKDSDARVRLASAQVLEEHADPGHRTQFLALLTDEHFEVRVTAIQFLGRLRDPGLAQPLVSLLGDADSDVRLAAAQALGPLRNPVAIEPLVLALADQEPVVRRTAVASLEQINRRWVRSGATKRAIPRLEALCRESQPWVVAAAQKVLEKLRAAQDMDTEFWNRESGIRNL